MNTTATLSAALRLKIPQVAELLGISTDTVDAMIARKIFAVQRGPGRKSHRHVPAWEVTTYIELLPKGETYASTVLRERRAEAAKRRAGVA
jgi:predicted DNA-binding transcriptional regulator AlpA